MDRKKNKNNTFLILLVSISLSVGIFVGSNLYLFRNPTVFSSTNPKKNKLHKLIDFIEKEYVNEIDTDSIVDVTVNEILKKLDPYSVYIPSEALQSEKEKMVGEFVGIGIQFRMYKDSLAVVKTLENGPSEKAGIRAGDRILLADKDTLFGKGLSSTTIVKKLKGSKNSKISLGVYRKTDHSYFTTTLSRGEVAIKSVQAYYMLNETMGYIKIIRFAESTVKEFKAALKNLRIKGMKNLTLDLRDNPGGYLEVANQIADEFLEQGKLILFTKDKKGTIEKIYATADGDFEEGNIFVLINEQSASASEVVAGALQDNDKGLIIGRRSFGKGLVQREMKLGDGSAVRLTISRYYTPTGRSIQKAYKKNGSYHYQKPQYGGGNEKLVYFDSIEVADSLKFTTPKGKIVYGGGGIIPDILVPISGRAEEQIEWLVKSGFLDFFIFEYLDKNRSRYSYQNKKDFIKYFKSDNFMFYDFQKYYSSFNSNLKLDFKTHETKIKQYLKATLASHIYDENTFNELFNQGDAMIKKALELEHLSQE